MAKKNKFMKIPKGMTEQEVVDLIKKVSFTLSYKFRFGYFTAEDIQQECMLLAVEALEKYDSKYPLENFLRVHLKNRLCNYKRNKFQRICELKCKCKLCKKKVEHEKRLFCTNYKQWYMRNLSKKHIILPIGIDEINDEKEANAKSVVDFADKIYKEEIFKQIDKKLPTSMRSDYVKLRDGDRLSKVREEEIMVELRRIVNADANQ